MRPPRQVLEPGVVYFDAEAGMAGQSHFPLLYFDGSNDVLLAQAQKAGHFSTRLRVF
jgi:hypothetical protein